jgi:hypothetical protein
MARKDFTYWNSSGSFSGNFLLDIIRSTARMRVQWIGRLRDDSIFDCIRCDQLAFTTVPFRKNLGRWGTS